MSTTCFAAASANNTEALQALQNGSPSISMIYDRTPIRDFGGPTSPKDIAYTLYFDPVVTKAATSLKGMPRKNPLLTPVAPPVEVEVTTGASLKRRPRVKTQRRPAAPRRVDSVDYDKENVAWFAVPALVGSRQTSLLCSRRADNQRRIRDWEVAFGSGSGDN
jgi:hypothetical protein